MSHPRFQGLKNFSRSMIYKETFLLKGIYQTFTWPIFVKRTFSQKIITEMNFPSRLKSSHLHLSLYKLHLKLTHFWNYSWNKTFKLYLLFFWFSWFSLIAIMFINRRFTTKTHEGWINLTNARNCAFNLDRVQEYSTHVSE